MAKITIVGTSHISPGSIESIKSAISKNKPDCVAVELDPKRYNALIYGERKVSLRYGLFATLLAFLQKKLGEKTGIFPGDEMLFAINYGRKNGAKIVLIDMDILDILNRLKSIGIHEKIRLFIGLFFGFFVGEKINLNQVPQKKVVKEVLKYMRRKFPNLYRVLVRDRNKYMVEWIKKLSKEYKRIVVVVGAGHVDGLKRMLKRH